MSRESVGRIQDFGLAEDRAELTVRYGDQEETIGAGEAFYMPPGHVPGARAGSEFVQFSPAAQLRDVQAAMAKAMAQLQGT
ncbi:MAG TPA: hypothetical protein VGG35_10085 [Streptosporangiaceae bacterium]